MTEPVVWWVTIFSSSEEGNFHSKYDVKYISLALFPQYCDLLLTCKVLGKVEWLLCLKSLNLFKLKNLSAGAHRGTCKNFLGSYYTPGNHDARFLPGSHGKELFEGTQRKAGVFAFTITNLRGKEDVPLLKIWKGNGNFARILLRDFLPKAWRVNKTILHCTSAHGSSVFTSLWEAVV